MKEVIWKLNQQKVTFIYLRCQYLLQVMILIINYLRNEYMIKVFVITTCRVTVFITIKNYLKFKNNKQIQI